VLSNVNQPAELVSGALARDARRARGTFGFHPSTARD
jgi:hypothetical protein